MNTLRVIDYPISNCLVEPCFRRPEALSDHCIEEFKVKNGPKKSEHHLRFMPGQSFIQPLWLSKQRWHTLFEIAHDEEQKKQWAEACHMVENHHDWDSYEDEEQMMIDYLWTFTCAKLTCIFKMGYWLSDGIARGFW